MPNGTRYLKVSNLFGEEGFEAEVCSSIDEAIDAMLSDVSHFAHVSEQTLRNEINTKGCASDNTTYWVNNFYAIVNCQIGWRYRCTIRQIQPNTEFMTVVIKDEASFDVHEFCDLSAAQRFMTDDFAIHAHLNKNDVYDTVYNDYDVIDTDNNGITLYCDENGGYIFDGTKNSYFSQVFGATSINMTGIPLF